MRRWVSVPTHTRQWIVLVLMLVSLCVFVCSCVWPGAWAPCMHSVFSQPYHRRCAGGGGGGSEGRRSSFGAGHQEAKRAGGRRRIHSFQPSCAVVTTIHPCNAFGLVVSLLLSAVCVTQEEDEEEACRSCFCCCSFPSSHPSPTRSPGLLWLHPTSICSATSVRALISPFPPSSLLHRSPPASPHLAGIPSTLIPFLSLVSLPLRPLYCAHSTFLH